MFRRLLIFAREKRALLRYFLQYSENLVQDLDLIVLGGYYGDGKCTGRVKSFMMGVAASHEEDPTMRFLCVVSVSSGIGNEMLRDLQTKFEPHWVKERPENVTGPKVRLLH